MSYEQARAAAGLTVDEIEAIIARAHWQSARSTEDVAPHQYVVKGWDKDELTEDEFWRLANWIRTEGRLEEWTPPAEWVRRWGGRPMTNRYVHIGNYAYWFTWPKGRAPMLNREHVSVQQAKPTRRPVGVQQELDMG
jgi:hypothetical protein